MPKIEFRVIKIELDLDKDVEPALVTVDVYSDGFCLFTLDESVDIGELSDTDRLSYDKIADAALVTLFKSFIAVGKYSQIALKELNARRGVARKRAT